MVGSSVRDGGTAGHAGVGCPESFATVCLAISGATAALTIVIT
jgi:hypothetical protein